MSAKKAGKRHNTATKRTARSRRLGQGPVRSPLAGTSHTTLPGGNIFADLGFPPEEAENLKIRARLMVELQTVVDGMTQAQAATLLGVSQPRISHLARGKIGLFTIDTLVNMLAHAGARMSISVKRPRRPAA